MDCVSEGEKLIKYGGGLQMVFMVFKWNYGPKGVRGMGSELVKNLEFWILNYGQTGGIVVVFTSCKRAL